MEGNERERGREKESEKDRNTIEREICPQFIKYKVLLKRLMLETEVR